MADIPIGDLRVASADLLVETLLRLQKELRELRAERDHFRDAAKMVQPAAESVACSECGHENWIMYGKAPAQITDADKRTAAPQPVGEPAENSYEWFQREIQRMQQHVAETWPDWMKRTSGLSTATFPTVGEVPMPEPDGSAESDIKPLPGGGYQQGYAAGVAASVAALVSLKPKSGVNSDGTAWLLPISRQDCVEAVAALRGEVKS